MGAFLGDVFLQVLSFVAENERKMIRMWQAEGIQAPAPYCYLGVDCGKIGVAQIIEGSLILTAYVSRL